nr:Tn3 family transposase [Frankia sp. Cr1]
MHIQRVVDDETYRRQIKSIRNLQEGRHALGRRVFHGSRGDLRQKYLTGMEDQLGVLGLVLNAIVLFNTRYLNAALDQLRADGYPVLDNDVAHLSPFGHKHINFLGRYAFSLPNLTDGLRPLRDPNEPDDEDEEN